MAAKMSATCGLVALMDILTLSFITGFFSSFIYGELSSNTFSKTNGGFYLK